MNRVLKKHIIFVSVAIFLISIFLEIFIFNSFYFKISKSNRGLYAVSLNNLICNDLKIENNKIYITGSNPYFIISTDKYAELLKFDLNRGSENFHINLKDDKGHDLGTYYSNCDIKNYVNIKIDNTVKNIKFYIKMDNNGKYVGLREITIDNNFYFNFIRFLITIGIFYLILVLVIYKYFLIKNLHIAFLILCLTLGTLMSICVPPYYSYDECAHFTRAYETASFNLNFSNNEKSNWVTNIDDFIGYSGHGGLYNSYKDRIDDVVVFFKNDYSNIKHIGSPEDTYLFVPYIPAAMGIYIGKMMKLPFIFTFYLGRFFSLLVYSLLGSLIIKHIKIAKRLVFMILLFPTSVLVAEAYSVDPMTIIFSLASMAIFINMLCAEKNSLGYKKIMGLVACISIAAMCKVTYAPLILIIFAVPNIKFKNCMNGKILLIKILSLLPVGLAAIGTFLYGLSKDINQWKVQGVDVKKQVLFIANDIPGYIYVAFKYMVTNLLPNIEKAIGLLAYCGDINPVLIFVILISLILVAVSDNESQVLNLGIKVKSIILVAVVLSLGLAITALYVTFTPVGKNTIDGFQGRYVTPLLLPILLLLKNNKISNGIKKENLNYFIILESSFILVISILKIFLEFNN